MPILLIPLLLAGFLVLAVLLAPLVVLGRFRAATARQKARGCLALANVVTFGISAVMMAVTAVVTSFWEPRSLPFVGLGLVAGLALGGLALVMTHWEETDRALYLRPNRILVVAVLLVVGARLLLGLWRVATTLTGSSAEGLGSTVAGSLAAGALLVGYSFVFWAGVHRRARQFRRSRAAGPADL